MKNNDVLRRVRYILDFNDKKMIEVFSLGELNVSRESVSNFLKKDDDPEFQDLKDVELAMFLNGLISNLRGKKEGDKPVPEQKLTSNIVFRKLNIAFGLRAEDVIEVLELVDFKIGKHELSAFFRKPSHKNYRECKSQILRNYLNGLQKKFRN